jgi:hypothetical protein
MIKHKIRMLSTQKGVHDGELHPVAFHEGEEYEIGPDLLQAFINCGAVELVEDDSPAESDEKGVESAGSTSEEDEDAPESGETDAEADETTAETGEKSKGEAPANKMKTAAPENKARK